jgi:hypothetical protein
MDSSILKVSKSPQRSILNSGVSGSSIVPPRVQTSASHAHRYEGTPATAETESKAVGHLSQTAIANSLNSRNTQVVEACSTAFPKII